MNCGERHLRRRQGTPLRARRRRPAPGQPRRHRARQRRRRRADDRRRHRPGQPEDRRPGPRLDQHPHGRLRAADQLHLRLLGRRRQHRPVLDLRPERPRPPRRGRLRPEDGRASRASSARPPATSGTSTTPASAPTPGSTAPRCGAPRNPRAPRLVTTTGAAGQGSDPKYPGWNDFILHNSQRPNAKAFRNGAAPSLANGNILLVTEEDYEQPDCSQAGSFQTWWVKRLDGTKDAIVPLDKVELSDLGHLPDAGRARSAPRTGSTSTRPASSRPGSTAAAPSSSTYGTPRTSRPTATPPGALEVWDSYWMPVYSKAGVMTAKKTNLAYSVDLARGIDVYRVDLPGSTWDTNVALARPDRRRLGHRPAPWPRVLRCPRAGRPPPPAYGDPLGRARLTSLPGAAGHRVAAVRGLCEHRRLCTIGRRVGGPGPVGPPFRWLLASSWVEQHRRRPAWSPPGRCWSPRRPVTRSWSRWRRVLQYLPSSSSACSPASSPTASTVAGWWPSPTCAGWRSSRCSSATIVSGEVNIAVVLTAVFLLGMGETFADTTTSTLLPMIVQKRDLGIANARVMAGIVTLNQLAGPPIGALLFGARSGVPVRDPGRLPGAGRRPGAAGAAARPRPGPRRAPVHRPARHRRGAALGPAPRRRPHARADHRHLQRDLRCRVVGAGALLPGAAAAWARSASGCSPRRWRAAGCSGTFSYGWLERHVSLGNIMRVGLVIETLTHLVLAVNTLPAVAMVVMFVFGAHAFVWGTTSHERAPARRTDVAAGPGRERQHARGDGRHGAGLRARRPDRRRAGGSPRRSGSASWARRCSWR